MRNLIIITIALLASGCASAPKPLQGSFSEITPSEATASSQTGAPVRWGGEIINVEPARQSTCFEVLARPLSGNGRPVDSDQSQGRFLACRSNFYDPAAFAAGRDVTFTGRIDSYQSRLIGEYDYSLPRLAADVVYLWPERDRVANRGHLHTSMFFYRSPFWWGYW